jgi:hypothetical protein
MLILKKHKMNNNDFVIPSENNVRLVCSIILIHTNSHIDRYLHCEVSIIKLMISPTVPLETITVFPSVPGTFGTNYWILKILNSLSHHFT